MKISQQGIDLIKHFEGCRLTAYQDSVGVWTIGYGSTMGVHKGQTITQEEAEARLLTDLEPVYKCLYDKIFVLLDQYQYDALCSWIFNLGCGNFMSSTLRRLINEGDFIAAQREFGRWIHAGGQVLPGLVKRRAAEAAMFGGDPDATSPLVA